MDITKDKVIHVIVPEHVNRYRIAKKSKKTGKPRYWTVNGQGLYNGTMHHQTRSKMTSYYHDYLSKYIKKQITSDQINLINQYIHAGSEYKLSISLDIYEIQKGKIPDVSNLWVWIKWFEDALQKSGIIENDDPKFVIESGRKRYHWVDNPQDRKLIFNIHFLLISKNKNS